MKIHDNDTPHTRQRDFPSTLLWIVILLVYSIMLEQVEADSTEITKLAKASKKLSCRDSSLCSVEVYCSQSQIKIRNELAANKT